MSRRGFYSMIALACVAAYPASAQEAVDAPHPDAPPPVTGESNTNPHFRKCMMRDMPGTWEMVGVAGKILEVFPNDPICHKFQWLVFEEGVKSKHVFYKEGMNPEKTKKLVESTPANNSYSMDGRGVLTFTQPDGKMHQICTISMADDGNSKAGDMLLTSLHGGKPALFRLFRKTDKF